MAKRSGYKYVTYLDDNPLSPTYMETYVEKVEDTEKCPIEEDDLVLISNECELSNSGYTGYRISVYFNRTTNEYSEVKALDTECEPSSTEEQWIASGDPYCETTEKGVNTGYMVQVEVQMNPNLSNYGEKRYEKYKSPECEANNCAIWDEVSHACHISVIDCVATFDGTADITEIDINPLSDTYNTTRTVNRVHNDCQNCTNTLFEWRTVGTMCGDDEILCGNGIQQASTNSYLVSQRYKIIGSGTPTPMDEYQVVLYAEDDENCGYIKPMYKMEKVGGYLCDYETYTKYERYARMVSYDSGVTWSVAQPLYTERGEVIAEESYDCGKPMYRWIDNGETTCVDNGDDAKLLIQDGNGNVIYKLPCNESSSLSCDELEGMVSNMQNARFVTFGNCISTINSPLISECNYHTKVGDSGAGESARLKFGDYVEVIGSHDVFQHSYLFNEAYWKAYDDTFGEHLRIIRGEALGGMLEAEDNIIHLKSGIELIESGGLSMRYGGNSLIMDAATPPSIGNNAFSNIDGIFVPSGTVEAYRETWEGKYEDILFSLAEEDTFYRATYDNDEQGWNFSSEGTNGVLTKAMTHASYKGKGKANVTDVYLSNQVREIGESAFSFTYYSEFSGLTSIDLSQCTNLRTIGEYAFYKCSGLRSIKLPEGLTTIGNNAFQGCSALTSIVIPSTVTSIPNAAFEGCWSLSSVTFANNSQLTTIGNNAFQGCSALTSIVIPSTVTSIGEYVFTGCIALADIIFANNSQLTTIGNNAFTDSAVRELRIPDSVTSFGYQNRLSSLTAFTYSSGCTTPGGIRNCSSLQSVVVPDTVIYFDDTYAYSSFYNNNSNCRYYFYPPTPPNEGNDLFNNSNVNVFVPCDNYAVYTSSTFANTCKITPIDDNCCQRRWVDTTIVVCVNEKQYYIQLEMKRYPSGDTWTEWEYTGSERPTRTPIGDCPIDHNGELEYLEKDASHNGTFPSIETTLKNNTVIKLRNNGNGDYRQNRDLIGTTDGYFTFNYPAHSWYSMTGFYFGSQSNISRSSVVGEIEIGNCYVKYQGEDWYVFSMEKQTDVESEVRTLKMISNNNIYTKIYYVKIYEGDVLVRDFVPVRRTSNNQVTLYDKRSGIYLTPDGILKGSDE